MNTINAISIKDLNKIYKGKTEVKALDNISIDIPKGSLFGLLGTNGAGKSTLINIMAGLVIKSSGAVKIWESDIDKNPRQAKASIGIVPQELNFDPFFTPYQLLELQAGMYGVPKKDRITEELLKMVNLENKKMSYTRGLSGGMRRRLMIAKALVHKPPILVLDEPTAGVDVELRRQLWKSVKELNKKGVTIILTTHYLEEAEELCDYIAIINKGKIVANDKKENLLSTIESKEINFTLDREIDNIPKELTDNTNIKGKRTLSIRYNPKEQQVERIIKIIQKEKYNIIDISTKESDLEDIFLQLTKASTL